MLFNNEDLAEEMGPGTSNFLAYHFLIFTKILKISEVYCTMHACMHRISKPSRFLTFQRTSYGLTVFTPFFDDLFISN